VLVTAIIALLATADRKRSAERASCQPEIAFQEAFWVFFKRKKTQTKGRCKVGTLA
jgi:hypothetical protein